MRPSSAAMDIIVHPDDWASLAPPADRQKRYADVVECNTKITMRVDEVEQSSRGELRGSVTRFDPVMVDGNERMASTSNGLPPYQGEPVPACLLPTWEHHLSELLGLEYPCVDMGQPGACYPRAK